MGLFQRAKNFVKPLVDFPRWMQLRHLSRFGKDMVAVGKDIFVVKSKKSSETFEQVMNRLGLTENDIQSKLKDIRRLVIFYMTASILVLTYSAFHFIAFNFKAGFISLAVLTIPLSQLFRNHFWWTQLKYRQLGLDFKSWFRLNFMGKKS